MIVSLASTLLAFSATFPQSSTTIQSGQPIPDKLLLQLEGMRVTPSRILGGTQATPPAQAKSKEDAKKELAAKMGRLQKAPLDRRASVRLSIWAKSEPLPADEDPELALPEEPPKGEKPTAPKTVEQLFGPRPKDPIGQLLYIAKEQFLKPTYDELKQAYDDEVKALAKQMAEYQKKVAEITGKRAAREIEIFQRQITLGRWDEVSMVLAAFEAKGQRMTYETILRRLAQTPPQGSSNLQQFWEKNTFTFDDILSLIELAPDEFKESDFRLLSPLLHTCMAQGHDVEEWLDRLRSEVAKPAEERRLSQRQAALLLSGQGLNVELGDFLPSLEESIAEDDREGLNLRARYLESKSREDENFDLLEDAWEATLAALSPGEIEDKQKAEALKRAVSLAPRLQNARGDEWLVETFAGNPERGMEVLATIGQDTSTGMTRASQNPDQRLAAMKLMTTAVDALLEKAPERAAEWSEPLNLLADCWLREAQHSYKFSESDQSSQSYQRDPYGNIFWTSYNRGYSYNPVQPLAPAELLEIRPSGRWHELLLDSVRPKYDTTIAELLLKVNEEKEAFPYIEQLAKSNPKKANELAAAFLNVWITNNDPNSSRNRVDIYSFSTGFNNRASGIPLTRSKQERSLKDLAKWVGKLKAVEGLEIDSDLVMRAFTGTHSFAEVYRIESMETVFGSLEELEPKTLATMAQTMRTNLAGLWRKADVQANAKTKRKKKDIEAEVRKGYSMAQEVLGRALNAHPDNWRLQTARAAMMHDLNNYQNEIQKASNFSGNRQEALDLFAEAATNYMDIAPELRREERSSDAFTSWFYAALGASDVDAIDQSTILAANEIEKIRDTLEDAPEELSEKQLGMFSNALFTRLSDVNPAIKNRYLEAGFQIVGDHPQARAARKVYDYYADLITEIELVTRVDGAADVGSVEPFGVQVELLYTKEIERESGGFQKYLQNQANSVNSYYNYGRPQENYRDKFEEATRTILSEQFEVLSVTFNKEDVQSKGASKYGWRRTPYAYILLKAKGPEVDRIPPLKLDLDFNDVTGYVVLPISSPVVPIDASQAGGPRPFDNLQITQVVDERRSREGVLALEIKAQADGLVPSLETIMELAPADFQVDSTEDMGVSVARFGDDDETILTERLWNVNMSAREEGVGASTFRFAAPIDDSAKMIYQRYDDADLVAAQQEVNLLAKYEDDPGLPWLQILLGLVLVGAAIALIRWLGRTREVDNSDALQMPGDITPFTVIGLLRHVRSKGRLQGTQQDELDATVLQIERYYFDQAQQGQQPDLTDIARTWLRRA